MTEYIGTETDDASHQNIKVNVREILELDPDVANDPDRVRNEQKAIFVSVRFGDRACIDTALPNGEVAPGATLHLRGEWISKQKAYAHGGEEMAALHFTHQPLSFVCSEVKCYS